MLNNQMGNPILMLSEILRVFKPMLDVEARQIVNLSFQVLYDALSIHSIPPLYFFFSVSGRPDTGIIPLYCAENAAFLF